MPKMLSDEFLRGFKSAIRDTNGRPLKAEGAFDVMTKELKRRLARDAATAGLTGSRDLAECLSEFQQWAADNLDGEQLRAFTHHLETVLGNVRGGEQAGEDDVGTGYTKESDSQAADDPPPFPGMPKVGKGPVDDRGVRRATDACLALDSGRRELAIARMKKPWRRAVRDELQRRANDRSVPSFNEFLSRV
jgi:hypothetical protein